MLSKNIRIFYLALAIVLILLPLAIAQDSGHRISIRQNNEGNPEFYDTITGKEFIPRGNNYLYFERINVYQPKYAWSWYIQDQIYSYDVLLDPNYYNSDKINSDMRLMKEKRYNTIRIHIEHNPHNSQSLNQAYLSNLVDFIQKAKENDLYVIFSFGFIPKTYDYLMFDVNNVEGFNNYFLNPSVINALGRYNLDTLNYIQQKDPNLFNSILAVEPLAEPFFLATAKPFSLTSGLITFNGKTYDMSSVIQRQALADDATINWMNNVYGNIKNKYPNLLLSAVVIPPIKDSKSLYEGYNGVYTSDKGTRRFQSLRVKVVAQSPYVDYIDFHINPNPLEGTYTFQREMTASEITIKNSKPYAENIQILRPIILGEFGASKNWYPSIENAKTLLISEQSDSCRYMFTGWMNWAWTKNNLDDSFWNIIDNNYFLADTLSPKLKINPCSSSCYWSPDPLDASRIIRAQNNQLMDLGTYIEERLLCYNGRWYSTVDDWNYWQYENKQNNYIDNNKYNWGIIVVNPNEKVGDWISMSNSVYGRAWKRTSEIGCYWPPYSLNPSDKKANNNELMYITMNGKDYYTEERLLCHNEKWYSSVRVWDYWTYKDLNTGEQYNNRPWGIIVAKPTDIIDGWKIIDSPVWIKRWSL